MSGEGSGGMAVRGTARETMDMGDHGEMSAEDVERSAEQHTARTLWLLSLMALLGVWLLFAPATLGYGDPGQVGRGVADVTSTRKLSSIADRGRWMTWSDLACGVALVILASLSLRATRYWSRWAACLVGVWLMFAPLMFWASDEAAYGRVLGLDVSAGAGVGTYAVVPQLDAPAT